MDTRLSNQDLFKRLSNRLINSFKSRKTILFVTILILFVGLATADSGSPQCGSWDRTGDSSGAAEPRLEISSPAGIDCTEDPMGEYAEYEARCWDDEGAGTYQLVAWVNEYDSIDYWDDPEINEYYFSNGYQGGNIDYTWESDSPVQEQLQFDERKEVTWGCATGNEDGFTGTRFYPPSHGEVTEDETNFVLDSGYSAVDGREEQTESFHAFSVENTGYDSGCGAVEYTVQNIGSDSETYCLDSGESKTSRFLSIIPSVGDADTGLSTSVSSDDDIFYGGDATIDLKEYDVVCNIEGSGSVGGDCGGTVERTDDFEVEAYPADGWEFDEWTVDWESLTGSSPVRTFEATESKATGDKFQLTAHFEEEPDPANFEVSSQTSSTYWHPDGVENDEESSVRVMVENTGDEHACQTIEYDTGFGSDSTSVCLDGGEDLGSWGEILDVMPGSGDAGSYTGTVSSEDDSFNVDITVEEPPAFFDVDVQHSSSFTNLDVDAGEDIEVRLEEENTGGQSDCKDVTVDISGIGSQTENICLDEGESNTYGERYSFSTSIGDEGSYSGDVIVEDGEGSGDSFTAEVSTPTYNIDCSVSGSGSVGGDCGSTVEHGDSATVTADPDSEWMFDIWSGDTTSNSDIYTFSDVSSDISVTAEFIEEAVFSVSNVVFDDEVVEGNSYSGSATITNSGEECDSTSVSASSNVGSDSNSTNSLCGGDSDTVSFSISTSEGDGGQTVTTTVDSGDETESDDTFIELAQPDPVEFMNIRSSGSVLELPLVDPNDDALEYDHLRVRVNGEVLAADLVDTAEEDASNLRVRTSSGVLAWREN